MANRENSREQDELSQSTEVEETYFEDSQYDGSEYEDSEYEEYDEYEDYDDEEENSSLFAMSEEELDDRPGVNWLSVLSAAVAVILSIVLAVVGVRAFASVNNNAEYAGKSWVIQGTYQDLTPDLITKGNVARYKGNLPADDALNGKTYVSNLKDKYQVTSGAPIEFRGSQTGDVPSEFPREVDGLLVEKNGSIEVVYTAEKGTLKPVTEDSVNAERFAGIASIVGAVLVLLLGLGFAVWLNRHSRDVEYEDLEGLVEDER
jgi:predicted ATPase